MEKLTTTLDVAGTAVLVAGVFVLAGLGWAMVAAGAASLAVSWALSGRPTPRRAK